MAFPAAAGREHQNIPCHILSLLLNYSHCMIRNYHLKIENLMTAHNRFEWKLIEGGNTDAIQLSWTNSGPSQLRLVSSVTVCRHFAALLQAASNILKQRYPGPMCAHRHTTTCYSQIACFMWHTMLADDYIVATWHPGIRGLWDLIYLDVSKNGKARSS